MIAKLSRGYRVGGLLRYLLGPGVANEHLDARVVASWDGAPGTHQPRLADPGTSERDRVGQFRADDVAALGVQVAAVAVGAGIAQNEPAAVPGHTPARGTVWHCSVRNHASDRVLSDAEWEQVVVDVLHRAGIARRGEMGGCRWVAVRHAPDHVHIAAVPVRQDSLRKVHPRDDYRTVRDACQAAEVRYGLTRTGVIDRTAVPAPGRAELEKRDRLGRAETSREQLRRAVRGAAVRAQDPEAFFLRLADEGVLVRPRRHQVTGALQGYSVAVPGDVNADGTPVWFGGSSLARELSLPELARRWASTPELGPPIPPTAREHSRVGRAERGAAADAATTAAREATRLLHVLRAGAGRGVGELGQAPGVVHATGDLITAVSTLTAGGYDREPVRGNIGDLFDRATRQAGVGQPDRWSDTAQALRSAAWQLARIRRIDSRFGDNTAAVALLVACAALVAEIIAYHHAAGRHAQADAARRTEQLLRAHPYVAAATTPGSGAAAAATSEWAVPHTTTAEPRLPPRRTPPPPPATAPRRAPTLQPPTPRHDPGRGRGR